LVPISQQQKIVTYALFAEHGSIIMVLKIHFVLYVILKFCLLSHGTSETQICSKTSKRATPRKISCAVARNDFLVDFAHHLLFKKKRGARAGRVKSYKMISSDPFGTSSCSTRPGH
jgi:hypothetical protein